MMELPEKRCGPAENFIAELQKIAVFAELLEHYLRRKKVRQAHLAKQIFVHPATVHNWRTNKRLPDNLGVVYQVSKALQLSPFEAENLIQAWRFGRAVRDWIPYVEEATKHGNPEEAIQLARSILSAQRQPDN